MSGLVKLRAIRRTVAAFTFTCGVIVSSAHIAVASDDALVFQQCTFEANRYVVCRVPPRAVEAALQSADRVHAGVAFGTYVIGDIQRRGCTGKFDDETFILNGVFFSVDSRGLEKIDCPGRSAKLKFTAEKVTAFEFLQFFFDQ